MIVWKLDELMRVRRIKGRELARRMGIGENYLSRVRHEVPDRLSLALLDGLCRELECTLADLLEYRPSEPVPMPVPVRRMKKAPSEPEAIQPKGAYVRGNVLQARLQQLKRRRIT